ncbi:hypothetical protein [Flavicella sp.]|uniref:hypothetical protein n=1 Tax=Flavicella sp. TaxID=2957742 RepID=UPI0026078464|nr:hypothetical protein [Flavicella sp.]MDG1804203.1 hypothetical protein [Flavicella sp.]
MSFVQKLKKEIIEILLVTAYFLLCFGVLILIKKLTLAQVEVEFYGFSAALVGALVMSKVVILLDKTPLGKMYVRQALYKNVLFKSIIYTLVLTFVLFIENLIHTLLEGNNFMEAIKSIHEHRDPMQFRLILIASFFSLGSYNVIIAIRDSMEKGALTKLFFKTKENQ